MKGINASILFVDDERQILDGFRRLLGEQASEWDMKFVDSVDAAWKELENQLWDLVVSDVSMPGKTGLQLLEEMAASPKTQDLPVIMVTGLQDRTLKRKALDLGATDLLTKPVEPEDLIARIRSALRLKSYQDELRAHNQLLEQKVRERTWELEASQLDIIWSLSTAAEFRDEDTGNHVARVGFYSKTLGEKLGMGPSAAEQLFLTSPLHDIGKIGIPDRILLKPGPLSPEEWRVMQRHCEIGAAILRRDARLRIALAPCNLMENRWKTVPLQNPLLESASLIALCHHEKWDGTGYPAGLAGEQIPLQARIVAMADVYDAVRTRRCYKQALSHEQALEILHTRVGSHFDPQVTEAFWQVSCRILEISEQLTDSVETGGGNVNSHEKASLRR